MSMPTPFAPAPMQAPPPPAPAPAPVDGQPLARRPKSFFTGRFGLVFGLVVVVLTVAAIALASVGPLFVNHSAIPAGMTKVFDGVPNDSSAWRAADGCALVANGLDVDSSTRDGCQFVPSVNADLLSQGFYLSVTLAPDASVTNAQEPVVAFSNDEYVALDQSGAYLICTGIFDRFGNNICVSDYSSAWHTDGYTPNAFTLVYQPGADNGQDALVLFINGQQTRTVDLSLSSGAGLVLAAAEPAQGERGEAIYTHVTFYTASSQGS